MTRRILIALTGPVWVPIAIVLFILSVTIFALVDGALIVLAYIAGPNSKADQRERRFFNYWFDRWLP